MNADSTPALGPASDAAPPVSVMADAVCLGCGCLCDDITLRLRGCVLEAADAACPLGQAWFQERAAERGLPEATLDGRAVAASAALAGAVRLLAGARRVLITGLVDTTLEAQGVAVALADLVGATIDPALPPGELARLRTFQRVGGVSASLGEVRNRADLVVFWFGDPATTHPRHASRYSIEPAGWSVPAGRADRIVLVADATLTATGQGADHALRIRGDQQLQALCVLRLLVRDPDDAGLEALAADLPLEELRVWAARLRGARYAAVFLGDSAGDDLTRQALVLLVRELNRHTRCVALSLGGPGNPAGAEAVLTWQSGFPRAVDLSGEIPRFRPREATAAAMLEAGEADAVVVVGEAGVLDESLSGLAEGIPVIRIGWRATEPGRRAAVGLRAAVTGLETDGTVLRCDGMALPLRAARAGAVPSEAAWLERLRAGLERAGGAN